MLALYYKPTCPFSQAVLGEAEGLGVTLSLKDISTDDVLQQELEAKGGKLQTPFLVDTERDVSMYESRDIIEYLSEHYAAEGQGQTFGGMRIHNSDEICDSCQ